MSGSVSPLPWTGSKGCIYTTIDAFMPPHKTYVEACMGSAEVFLRKKLVEREIINDYNGDLVKFFRVLQQNEKLAYLLGRLYLSFNSEELFRINKAMLADVPNILDDLTETSVTVEKAEWSDIEKAVAFFENQIFSFSSTGKTFAIAKKDMTKRFGRLVTACSRLRNAVIMHRDYKDCISYAAGKDTFILLDPPYKGTEKYYQKANFGSDEHAKLFEFMYGIHEKYEGTVKTKTVSNSYAIGCRVARDDETVLAFTFENCYTTVESTVSGCTKMVPDNMLGADGLSLMKLDTDIWAAGADSYPYLKIFGKGYAHDVERTSDQGVAGRVWSGKLAARYARGTGTKDDPYIMITIYFIRYLPIITISRLLFQESRTIKSCAMKAHP